MSKKISFESAAYNLFDLIPDLDTIHLNPLGVSGFTILGKHFFKKEKLAKKYFQVVGSLYDLPVHKKYKHIDAILRPKVAPPASELNSLKPHEVFVYASSLSGAQGSPSAKRAITLGAETKIAEGPSGPKGQCYAIPVRDKQGKPLPPESIDISLAELVKHAKKNKKLHFLVPELTRELGMLNLFESTKLMFPLEGVRNIYLPSRILGHMYDNWGKF